MQSNSYVFAASMSPGGFAGPMSPAFGDARGGLVAGNDPVVTEVEPGSACAGRVQEPPETVEEINVDVPPEARRWCENSEEAAGRAGSVYRNT